MSYFRARSTVSALLVVLLTTLFAGCGSDPEPIENQNIDINDVDIPDTGFHDTDSDTNTDTDIDPIDPGVEPIECDNPIPEPPSGERCSVTAGTSDYILMHGTVLAGDDVYTEGTILLDDQSPNRSIICSGCDCADEPEAAEATVIACPDGVISPGLINPHDHLTYAEGRPQTHGDTRYDHRHDWRRGERGHTSLSTNPRTGAHREGVLLGELRMLFGGATSIAGSIGSTNASGFLRNLDNQNHTEGLADIDVNYSTFPLGDATPLFLTEGCGYPNIQGENSVEGSNIYLPHISEGIDAEAQNELHCLAGESGRNLVRNNTSIIHGIAVDARDVALIADRGAHLVWSARTNIDLYGNTAPVTLYHRFGVPIALGTDWTTSGSMNMLRELQCADYLNRMHYNETFTDRDIWKMATYNGAVSMGAEHKLGLIDTGYVADITIFDGTDRQPYRAVIDAEIDDIAIVLRGGTPIYGDASLIEGLVDAAEHDQCETIDVCGRDRRVCAELDAGITLSEIQNGVHPDSYPMFFCDEPEDEPSCVPARPSEYDGITTAQDISGDGIPDAMDNCPDYFNPIRPMDGETQSNVNGNGFGDVCDPCPLSEDENCTELDPDDWSGDGIANDVDNCPYHYNPLQEDTSEDGLGDACHPCPDHNLSVAGACPGSIYDIKTGESGAGARLALNDVLVTGVVPDSGIFLQVHPDDDEFIDAEYSGLYAYLGSSFADDLPAPGDRVTISGTVANFFDQIQLATVTTLEVISQGNDLPEPVVVDAADIATGGSMQEALEAVLVSVEDVQVTDTDVAAGPGDSDPSNEFIVDGSLNINDFFYLLDPLPAEGDTFVSITGILQWANQRSKLNPRSADDVITGPPELDRFEPDFVYLDVAEGAQPALTLSLNRPAEQNLTVDLTYSDESLVAGPASVDINQGEQSATIELEALLADETPVEIIASLDGIDIYGYVRTLDANTPRVLESLTAGASNFQFGSTISLTAALDVPAGDTAVDLTFEIVPGLDATYDTNFSFAPGEQEIEIEVVLGSDLGQFDAEATVDGTTLTFPFEVVDAPDEYTETFESLDLGSSYNDGTYVGDNGFTWEYAGARTDSNAASIDGVSVTFGPASSQDSRFVRSVEIPGGITSFSVQLQKAFTSANPRQVELFINGVSQGVSVDVADDDVVYDFTIDDININGDFDLELRSVGAQQIAIDNLTWTSGQP